MENRSVTETLMAFALPSYKEIPDVGLYLDQVVKYINGFFNDFPEMKITSSMVSNYVKQKIISSPHKKTYSRDQIAALLFIVIAKTVLSMDHIRLYLSMPKQYDSHEAAYTAFSTRLKDVLGHLSEETEIRDDQEQALNHIVITAAHKMYLERYFENIEQKTREESAKKEQNKSAPETA